MTGKRRLTKSIKGLDVTKQDKPRVVRGILGNVIGGIQVVEIPTRPGYVWVRLRDQQSEIIQAFNDNVSPVYDLPVFVTRDSDDPTRYIVQGRDTAQYQNWGAGSAYLPRHANQHSFSDDAGAAGDVVWVYGRQFMPLLAYPSGSNGASNVIISPYTYFSQAQNWVYSGNTGTASITAYKPTGSNARVVLIYMDVEGNPQLLPGDYFAATITGTSQVIQYLPDLPNNSKPIAAIRLVSGTSIINWSNIYDIRQFYNDSVVAPTTPSLGIAIYDDHVFVVTGTVLDFTDNIAVAVTGSSVFISSSAAGGGGLSALPIQDDGVFIVSGTAISFDKDLIVTASGTVAHVEVPAGTFASGSHTHPAGAAAVNVYEDSIFKATGTSISFDKNLSVVATGTVAYIDIPDGIFASGSHTHPVGSTAIQIFEDNIFKVTGTAISFNDNMNVAVTGTVAFVSSTGGTTSTGSANHSYYHYLCALLEPDAIEPLQFDTFAYQFTGTKYLLASWQTRIGSNGRMEVRNPHVPLPLNGVTLSGTAAGSTAVILDPSIPSYADAYTKYYDRLLELALAQTRYLPIEQGGAPGYGTPFLPGAYGAIITRVVNFEYAYIGGAFTGKGWNFANEINDTQNQRHDNPLTLAVNKYVISEIVTADSAQTGGIIYYLCPSTWSVISDSTAYIIRDDFMGTALDIPGSWTRTGSSIQINTRYQWVSISGTSSWGANGIISSSGTSRITDKTFIIDVYVGRNSTTNNSHIVGFSSGAGYSFSNFSHGVLLTSTGAANIIKIYEDGNDRGTVGSGYTNGGIYRIKITLNGNAAIYQIQGGTEYQKLGGSTWTTITPGTTSSSTDPLYIGVSVGQTGIMYVSDPKVYQG